MHLLLTGGCGLIGSALAARALRAGCRVTVLDNLSTGRRRNLARELASDRQVQLVVGDVADDDLVGDLMKRCDRVAHLAAGVGVGLVLSRPTGALRQSLLGSETVFRHAAAWRRPVFFASTSEVYGDSDGEPLDEARAVGFGSPDRLRFSYAAGKAAGEALAFAYAHEYKLPVAVGRFFNVTGPAQRAEYGAVVPTFFAQALSGGPLTIHGDGAQTRSFLDVRDAAEYVWRLLDAASPDGVLANIGRDAPVSVLELARRVRDLVDPDVRIETEQAAYGAGFVPIRHRRPDVARLVATTGHRPRYALDETLQSFVASMTQST